MDGTQVGILKKVDQIGLGRLLQTKYSTPLPPSIVFEVLGDFTHQSLVWKLSDEQIGALLVSPNLPEGHCSRTVAVGLLDAASCGLVLFRRFCVQLFAWCLPTSALSRCLLGSVKNDIGD